ncbi:nucleotidyltransferase/DNA polymerase [Advenella kashmirensis WT001]|uniref:Nucleotidyltransferase/DNA polymerase n=1 Tax=Advenella kashmirensis (strain DSM 17095 / LMG 22695 / WT001) TaxID=1036672 RepID=I3UA02_ADVKW|nr:hypothetical protein [Advenella kashmirensis]AFK61840.1 nucleotidyltransferase/DNA polymerase [Advenella kashmirensis WT001]
MQETAPVADDLFPERGGTPQDRQRILEIILARLGHDRVLAPQPVADHRPEVANRWGPANMASVAGPVVDGVTRPCWLLEKPLLLSVRKHRPWYGSPCVLCRGPKESKMAGGKDGRSETILLRKMLAAYATGCFENAMASGAGFCTGFSGNRTRI